jgi:hypothetical protein
VPVAVVGEYAARIMPPGHAGDEQEHEQRRHVGGDPHRLRARAPQRVDAEHDVHEQQQHLRGQPRLYEWVLVQDRHQQQRGREQSGVDRVGKPAQRRVVGPRYSRDRKQAARGEQRAGAADQEHVRESDLQVKHVHIMKVRRRPGA